MAKILVPVSIATTKLVLCDWNCNVMSDVAFANLTHIMGDEGFDESLHVVPMDGKPGFYLVVGGEHRYKAAKANGLQELPCYILEHLVGKSEAELQMWSVRRNQIKGKIDKAKYAKIEQNICRQMDLQAKVARKRMLVRESMAAKSKAEYSKTSSSSGGGAETDGERDKRKTIADRTRLLANAKTFQQECLVDSADTVEHGYLYVGQNGKSHLIVDASKKLHGFISAMVRVCKNDSARIDDFLAAAIQRELKNWD